MFGVLPNVNIWAQMEKKELVGDHLFRQAKLVNVQREDEEESTQERDNAINTHTHSHIY